MSFGAKVVTIFLIILCASGTSCAAASGDLRDYRLRIGDKIKVIVFGEKELSDELLIDGAGNIQMPLVGPLQLKDKTLAEARESIVERLESGFMKDPLVTVRVSELRPIFVLGNVRTPGQRPFKFGTTVLNAIAMAGGLGSERAQRGGAMAAVLSAEERLNILSHRYANLLVRLARIEAERTGRDHFEVANVPEVISHIDISELVKREQERLMSSHLAHERLLSLLRDQKPTIAREIVARREEIASQKELVQLNKDQLKRISTIKLASRMLEIRTQIAQGQGLVSRLRGEIAALEEKLVTVEIRAEEASSRRQERIMKERADSRQKLSEVEASFPLVSETVELRRQQAGQIFETADWQRGYEISVKSSLTGQLKKVLADDPTDLEPGDTVIVRMRRPPKAGQRINKIIPSNVPREDPRPPSYEATRPGA